MIVADCFVLSYFAVVNEVFYSSFSSKLAWLINLHELKGTTLISGFGYS